MQSNPLGGLCGPGRLPLLPLLMSSQCSAVADNLPYLPYQGRGKAGLACVCTQSLSREHGVSGGKWIVKLDRAEVDAAWRGVAHAIRDGKVIA